MHTKHLICLCFCLILLQPLLAHAGAYRDAIAALDFNELLETMNEEKVAGQLGSVIDVLPKPERSAAAVLIAMGVLEQADVSTPDVAHEKIQAYLAAVRANNPALKGRLGESTLIMKLAEAFEHQQLLTNNLFLDALSSSLSDGVITGYDLRRKGVYDGFPAGQTLTYSQSNLVHMQQLVTLLAAEGINGWVYMTPKVSAFLFRDDWGSPGESVVTLPGGVRVMQGREIAALFHFDSAKDRDRFHEVVLQYAKKDTADEPGLIKSAWWQPFYYGDEAMSGFLPISLIVLSSERHEATLTVLPEKTEAVMAALPKGDWTARVDRVWVNPAFHRFLQGDYK